MAAGAWPERARDTLSRLFCYPLFVTAVAQPLQLDHELLCGGALRRLQGHAEDNQVRHLLQARLKPNHVRVDRVYSCARCLPQLAHGGPLAHPPAGTPQAPPASSSLCGTAAALWRSPTAPTRPGSRAVPDGAQAGQGGRQGGRAHAARMRV